MRIESSRVLVFLVVLVLVRALFHLIHWPVFEGPDEPFHLDRALAYTGVGPKRGAWVSKGVVDAIRTHPCGSALHRGFGCPLFQGSGAFNILRWKTALDSRTTEAINYEMHQPPLPYLIAGLCLRTVSKLVNSVEAALLLLRLIALFAFSAGVLITLCLISGPDGRIAVLLALMLPGAVEALIRGSNDPFLFLWTALILLAWKAEHAPTVLVMAAIGPLIKLSAFVICAAIILALWTSRRRAVALGSACASMLVFPVQWLRGWRWGGTVELNWAEGWFHEPPLESLLGFGRTVYTFLKTIFWLGGWSFYRAPLLLTIFFFLLLLGLVFASKRRFTTIAPYAGALGGVALAVAGFTGFAIMNRRLFGTWGGLGGWYFWGWLPWIALSASDLLVMRPSFRRAIIFGFLIFLLLTNGIWFREAIRLYGWWQ